jgi:hypothetical protein
VAIDPRRRRCDPTGKWLNPRRNPKLTLLYISGMCHLHRYRPNKSNVLLNVLLTHVGYVLDGPLLLFGVLVQLSCGCVRARDVIVSRFPARSYRTRVVVAADRCVWWHIHHGRGMGAIA